MTRPKSMTDEQLFELIRESHPPDESFPPAAAETEGDRVLSQILACDRTETEQPERSRRNRRRLIFGAASGVGLAGGAAATALVVVFAGSTPALAQAFPIFSEPPITVNLSVPGGDVELQDARAITTPYGTGYIATAENESELCVAIPYAVHSPWVAGATYAGRCDPIAEAEHNGFVLSYSFALPPAGSGQQFAAELVAVLPAGASNPTVHNADGTTTPLTAEDGIVTAIEQSPTTISYQAAGGQTVSFPVGPESTAGTSRLPGSWSPPTESTSPTTTPAGSSGAIGSATP